MEKSKIERYLNVIKRAVSLIEAELAGEQELTEELLQTPVQAPVSVEPKISARKKHVADLLAIDCWPEAVQAHLITKMTDEDQRHRAQAALGTLLDRDLSGLNFLDFGCGDGWITEEAFNRGAATATGYDISQKETWGRLPGPTFTSVASDLKDSHYDIIFLFDVLDHCGGNPLHIMDHIGRLLKPDGQIYVRCHPWTSPHATHLYRQGVNKAYLHLFLNWGEIRDLIGEEPVFTRVEKHPLRAYHHWFKDFEIVKEAKYETQVNDFFRVPAFQELLAKEQQLGSDEFEDFRNSMCITFVDFWLYLK